MCRDHSGPEKAADALRALATSAPIWPRVVLPLNQMVERRQQLSDLLEQGQIVSRWLYDTALDTDDLKFASQLNQFEEQFQALLGDMETRRSAHEVLLAQLREGDFLEAGSVRSTLSGLSTASKRARFDAGRDLAEVERAQAEERSRLEAYRSSLEGQAQAAMDALRAGAGESVPVLGR